MPLCARVKRESGDTVLVPWTDSTLLYFLDAAETLGIRQELSQKGEATLPTDLELPVRDFPRDGGALRTIRLRKGDKFELWRQ